MSIYTDQERQITDMTLTKKAYVSPVTRLYGAKGIFPCISIYIFIILNCCLYTGI